MLGHFGVKLGDAIHHFFAESELHHDGDGRGGFSWSGDGQLDVDGDGGIGGVVNVADEFFGDDGDVAIEFVGGANDFPLYAGSVGGDSAVDFAVEVFEDFGAALFLPVLRRFHRLAVFEDERIGERGVGAGFGFVVVGEVVARVRGAVGGRADFFDVEQIHEALVVLVGGEVGGRRIGGRRLWSLADEWQRGS